MKSLRISPRTSLILGDVAAIAVLTVVGFARHAEVNAGMRMLTTFLPLAAAWLVVAPWFGQFQPASLLRPASLLKTGLAAVVAAPLAALLRGLWLNAPILPIFVLVLAGFGALGLMAWRAAWWALARREVAGG